jgi:hypothetical protein
MRRSVNPTLAALLAGILTMLLAACDSGGEANGGPSDGVRLPVSAAPTVACLLEPFAAPQAGIVTVDRVPVVAVPEEIERLFVGWLEHGDGFKAVATVDCEGRIYLAVTARVRGPERGSALSDRLAGGYLRIAGTTTLG